MQRASMGAQSSSIRYDECEISTSSPTMQWHTGPVPAVHQRAWPELAYAVKLDLPNAMVSASKSTYMYTFFRNVSPMRVYP